MIRFLICLNFFLPPVRCAADATLLVLGDSLSAGYGMRVEQGWVALLEQRIAGKGYPYRVVNASVSGDTSRGALARLGPLLESERPALTIVELGGNDGLRGLPLDEIRRNLGEILAQVLASGSAALLLPMKLPPNYGPAYTRGFEQVYRDLAAEYRVALGDFILEDIALNAERMQSDGMHPTADAQPIIVDLIWPLVEPLLARTVPLETR
jgi:acyl-CoA thioesterase-1